MPQDFSFDIVSKTEMQEVANAVQQAQKELAQRFDFKGSKSSIELTAEELILVSDDEGKLRSVKDILESKLVKRHVSLKAIDYQKLEDVEDELLRNFQSQILTIHEVGEHILGGGGKRLRPALLLLASQMLRYDGYRDVIYAAVVEFIHTATLVHDDIIDEADVRR